MMKRKDLKEAEVKKHNPTLYAKVKAGLITLTEAHNIMDSEIMGISEKKGKGTRSNKITLEEEFAIINKRYKPKIGDWIELLKKEFPFTFSQHLKDD